MQPRSHAEKTDEILAAEALADPHAFTALIRRYESKMLAYVVRISGLAAEDAQDVLQEAFFDAYRHLADFDTSLKFSSWMYRIVHNRTVSEYRRRKKRMQDLSMDDADVFLDHLRAAPEGVQRTAERNMTGDAVRSALDALPERDRTVLMLAYLEERTYAEISDILQAPPGSVATWINRAKKKFRHIIIPV